MSDQDRSPGPPEMSEAEVICTRLGETLDAVEDSAESVASMIETRENAREVVTSKTYGDTTIHLHQLVEYDDHDWVVSELHDQYVSLFVPHDATTSKVPRSQLGAIEPQYATTGVSTDGFHDRRADRVPIFGY